MKQKLAAQLFTVRDLLREDFPGVLRELKDMGWAGVQIGGLFDYSKEEIAAVLYETGLKTAGLHAGIDRIRNDLQAVVEEADTFQTKDIICPFVPEDLRHEAGYRELKDDLNTIAGKLEKNGYRISYHNHDFEVQTQVDGKHALDFLLNPAEGNKILAEIDVYWVKKSGLDPLEYVTQFKDRMPIIHLKDMADNTEQSFTEIGNGIIDFAPILRWGEQNGIEWFAVEQDTCPGNPLESLAVSLSNLNRIIEGL
ncbi:sugar phosphate isomerase/epimerase [Bacillus sp. H-16]|nr:sugar phosphate isomerase/epimerase [Alteribacter salitolerans]